MKIKALFLLVLLVCLSTPPALHAAITFEQITSNTGPDVSSQMQLSITTGDLTGEVDFTFQNIGPITSIITAIYFDTGTISSFGVLGGDPTKPDQWILSSPGVEFTYSSKANLPAGKSIEPVFTIELAASRAQGKGANVESGINNSDAGSLRLASAAEPEYLTLRFSSALTADQLTSEILRGNFRVGMHVQSIGKEGLSASFVSTPEPTTIVAGALLLLPFSVSAFCSWQRRQKGH